MKLDLNDKQIIAALEDSFVETNEVLGRKFTQAIEDPTWPWPGETQRHRGEAVGSPRNIVDRGELVGSYQPGAGRQRYSHSWNAEHAMAVHEGSVYRDGSTMPGRPWARQTLRDTDVDELFAKLARSKLDNIK